MFEVWSALLNELSQFVIPDWGALIALIPIGILLLVLVVFAILFRRLLTAPKARRGFERIEPATPAGIHMPGPSFSPIFAAVGAFLMFLGLVFGGVILYLGAIAFALTLLYWLAEAMRVYDHEISASAPPLPVVVHDGPPEGVHMPGPSYRPLLGAIGATMLMLGLVFGGLLLGIGVIALIVTLIGWLVDAVKEYRKTVEADQTGHLENIPAAANAGPAARHAGRPARGRHPDPDRGPSATRGQWRYGDARRVGRAASRVRWSAGRLPPVGSGRQRRTTADG